MLPTGRRRGFFKASKAEGWCDAWCQPREVRRSFVSYKSKGDLGRIGQFRRNHFSKPGGFFFFLGCFAYRKNKAFKQEVGLTGSVFQEEKFYMYLEESRKTEH